MSNAHELKGLQVLSAKLSSELKVLEIERNNLLAEISKKKSDLNNVNQKIDNFANNEPAVTEHAMLRYLERVYKININTLQNEILTTSNVSLINFAGGNCKIKVNGFEFVVKNNKVVSII